MTDQPLHDPETSALEQQVIPAPVRPAITILVPAWSTPVVGLLMLVLGLAAGYYGRPFVNSADSSALPAAEASNLTPTNEEISSAESAVPGASSSDEQEAGRRALMEALIPQTVHFKGNPNAPITMIEFSDFQ